MCTWLHDVGKGFAQTHLSRVLLRLHKVFPRHVIYVHQWSHLSMRFWMNFCLATKSCSEWDPVNTGILRQYWDCAICLLGFNRGTTPRRITNYPAILSWTFLWTRLKNSRAVLRPPCHRILGAKILCLPIAEKWSLSLRWQSCNSLATAKILVYN